MCLGDSITGSPGCWRALLWRNLTENGYKNIDFVGTLVPQGCAFTYDGENEGHGGALAINIANDGNLTGWLSQTNPDVILMHLGTNDIWSGRANSAIIDAFTILLTQMRRNNPSITLLVAQILPVAPDDCADCVARTTDLDKLIGTWAEQQNSAQSPVIPVDVGVGWNSSSDTVDGVHPNDTGIVKLANAWYPALTKVLDKLGGKGSRSFSELE